MTNSFDLLVLGAGSGGLAAAKRARNYGAKVAIIEGDRVGGTCVIRGCVPKKLLVYGAKYRKSIRDSFAYGILFGDVHSDVTELLRRVRDEVDRLNKFHLNLLDKAGIELISGWGRFTGPNTIGVSHERSGLVERSISGSKVLIAVGGRPVKPKIPGSELAWVSDDMFLKHDYPSKVIVVGAGFIACEFSCILRGLGVSVVQVVRGSKLLRGFDVELSDALLEAMKDSGIEFYFDEMVSEVSGIPGKLIVSLDGGSQIECGGVLMATGRIPWLEGLGLDTAGVANQKGRIVVDEDSRTTVPNIYAVGDVTDRLNLTPVAIDEGRAFADSVFGGNSRKVNYEIVSKAVFSDPEVATVGLSEEAAIDRFGTEIVRVYRSKFRSMSRALPSSGPACLLKLVVDRNSERILGCHMVGENASEIIQMAAICLGMRATKLDFDRTMALHPSVSEEFVTMY